VESQFVLYIPRNEMGRRFSTNYFYGRMSNERIQEVGLCISLAKMQFIVHAVNFFPKCPLVCLQEVAVIGSTLAP